jgi:hypothetical protein
MMPQAIEARQQETRILAIAKLLNIKPGKTDWSFQ